MMENVILVLSWCFIGIGSFFILVGSIGLMRMPDVYTRMHAAGIKDTVGAGFLLSGLAMQSGFSLVTLKLFVLIVLFIFTSPVVTHALAQAALHDGVKPVLDESAMEENRDDNQ